MKTPQPDSKDAIPPDDYLLIVDRAIHWGWRRLGLEVEDDTDAETVRRGLEAAIAKRGVGDRVSASIDSPTCVVVLLKGRHRDAFNIKSSNKRLAPYEQPIRDFLFSDDEAGLIPESDLDPDELYRRVVEAVKAMDLADMLAVSEYRGHVFVRRGQDNTRGSSVPIGVVVAESRIPRKPVLEKPKPPVVQVDEVSVKSCEDLLSSFVASGDPDWQVVPAPEGLLGELRGACERLDLGSRIRIRPCFQGVALHRNTPQERERHEELVALDAEAWPYLVEMEYALSLPNGLAVGSVDWIFPDRPAEQTKSELDTAIERHGYGDRFGTQLIRNQAGETSVHLNRRGTPRRPTEPTLPDSSYEAMVDAFIEANTAEMTICFDHTSDFSPVEILSSRIIVEDALEERQDDLERGSVRQSCAGDSKGR